MEQAVLYLRHITLTAAETVETADRAAAFGAAAEAVLAAIQETAEQVEPMVLMALMGQEVLAQAEVALRVALMLVAVVKAQFALFGLRVTNVYSQQTG